MWWLVKGFFGAITGLLFAILCGIILTLMFVVLIFIYNPAFMVETDLTSFYLQSYVLPFSNWFLRITVPFFMAWGFFSGVTEADAKNENKS